MDRGWGGTSKFIEEGEHLKLLTLCPHVPFVPDRDSGGVGQGGPGVKVQGACLSFLSYKRVLTLYGR